jgi:hypothetical protein
MFLTVVFVGWLIAGLAGVAVRGKQPSRWFCLLVFLSSTLCAGVVQYFVSASLLTTKRHSAAHLVGVSSLRLKDDAAFIRKWLRAPRAARNDDEMHGQDLDWAATFRMKSKDISDNLAAVERNVFIRDYYSVWAGHIDANRNQLEGLAERALAADDGVPRQSNIDSYLEVLNDTKSLLERLAHEMRSRPPEAYYSAPAL